MAGKKAIVVDDDVSTAELIKLAYFLNCWLVF